MSATSYHAIYSLAEEPLFEPGANLLLQAEGACLTGVHLLGQRHLPSPETWGREEQGALLFRKVMAELRSYWQGEQVAFSFPYQLQKGTAFQQAVWRGLSQLPYGRVTTYQQLACELGCPRATRAVANAIGRNPLLFVLPCHRVIGKDRSLRGFAAGIHLKTSLLELEASHRDASEGLHSPTRPGEVKRFS